MDFYFVQTLRLFRPALDGFRFFVFLASFESAAQSDDKSNNYRRYDTTAAELRFFLDLLYYEFSAHIVEVLKFDPREIFCWIAVVAMPLPNIAFLK